MLNLVRSLTRTCFSYVPSTSKSLSLQMLPKYRLTSTNDPNSSNIFYEDLLEMHQLNQTRTNLSKHSMEGQIAYVESLIRLSKTPQDEKTQQKCIQHAEICLANSLDVSDYTSALKCGSILLNYLNSISSSNPYTILLLCSMASWENLKSNRVAGLELFRQAEDLFITMPSDQKTPEHSQLLARVASEFGLHEKCIKYSAEFIEKSDEVDWQSKVSTIFNLIESLITINQQQEAIAIGESFIESVNFNGINELPSIDLLTLIYERVISLLLEQASPNRVKIFLLQDELLSLAFIEDNGSMQSLKYTAVYNWKQDTLYSLIMERQGDILEILQEAEIRRAGKGNDVLSIDPQEKATQYTEQYQQIFAAIELQKDIYSSANALETFGADDDQAFERFTQLVEQCMPLEQKLIEAPVVDQYLVKNTYFRIKQKIPLAFQKRIEQSLSTKRLP